MHHMSLKIAEDHKLHRLSERSSLYCCSHVFPPVLLQVFYPLLSFNKMIGITEMGYQRYFLTSRPLLSLFDYHLTFLLLSKYYLYSTIKTPHFNLNVKRVQFHTKKQGAESSTEITQWASKMIKVMLLNGLCLITVLMNVHFFGLLGRCLLRMANMQFYLLCTTVFCTLYFKKGNLAGLDVSHSNMATVSQQKSLIKDGL